MRERPSHQKLPYNLIGDPLARRIKRERSEMQLETREPLSGDFKEVDEHARKLERYLDSLRQFRHRGALSKRQRVAKTNESNANSIHQPAQPPEVEARRTTPSASPIKAVSESGKERVSSTPRVRRPLTCSFKSRPPSQTQALEEHLKRVRAAGKKRKRERIDSSKATPASQKKWLSFEES